MSDWLSRTPPVFAHPCSSARLKSSYFDPAASLVIALLLAAVAVLLGRESGALLLAESANPEQIKAIREIILSASSVERVCDLLTMHLGPEQVLLAAELKFRGAMNVQELEAAIDRLEERIRKKYPTIQRIFPITRVRNPSSSQNIRCGKI